MKRLILLTLIITVFNLSSSLQGAAAGARNAEEVNYEDYLASWMKKAVSDFEYKLASAFIVLGLDPSKHLEKQELGSAFRTMAAKHHPDRGGDEQNCKIINGAYSFLKDYFHERKEFFNTYLQWFHESAEVAAAREEESKETFAFIHKRVEEARKKMYTMNGVKVGDQLQGPLNGYHLSAVENYDVERLRDLCTQDSNTFKNSLSTDEAVQQLVDGWAACVLKHVPGNVYHASEMNITTVEKLASVGRLANYFRQFVETAMLLQKYTSSGAFQQALTQHPFLQRIIEYYEPILMAEKKEQQKNQERLRWLLVGLYTPAQEQ